MMVNGEPRLTCAAFLREFPGRSIVVEPPSVLPRHCVHSETDRLEPASAAALSGNDCIYPRLDPRPPASVDEERGPARLQAPDCVRGRADAGQSAIAVTP
jgi:hypothetical protein